MIGPIKAKLRAEVLRSLEHPSIANNNSISNSSTSDEDDANLMINELLREYLIFNHLRETMSIFGPGKLKINVKVKILD